MSGRVGDQGLEIDQLGTEDSLPVPQPTQSKLQLTVRYGTGNSIYFNVL